MTFPAHACDGAVDAGFTLMEVMIAVVIMALGLGSLFASEAGAIRIAQRARTTTIATLLARCKMGEVEEKVAKEGWPGTALDGRDECCEDAEHKAISASGRSSASCCPSLPRPRRKTKPRRPSTTPRAAAAYQVSPESLERPRVHCPRWGQAARRILVRWGFHSTAFRPSSVARAPAPRKAWAAKAARARTPFRAW